MKKQMPLLVALALAVGACASMRGVDYGSGDPGQTYAIQVTNQRAGTITVSYSTGASSNELGTVGSGRTERFVIPMEAPGSVTISAVTTGGTSAGTRTVTLQPGVTTRITF